MSRRRITMLTVGGALAAAMAVTAAPATAAGEVTYSGTFTGIAFDARCTDPPTAPTTASGTWRVNVHESTVTARFVIEVDGVPHVAWTSQMARLPDAGTTFTAGMATPAGPLTVSLKGADLTYRISPYNVDRIFPTWPVCEGKSGVTYSGVVG